jgi:hypothetical protein
VSSRSHDEPQLGTPFAKKYEHMAPLALPSQNAISNCGRYESNKSNCETFAPHTKRSTSLLYAVRCLAMASIFRWPLRGSTCCMPRRYSTAYAPASSGSSPASSELRP